MGPLAIMTNCKWNEKSLLIKEIIYDFLRKLTERQNKTITKLTLFVNPNQERKISEECVQNPKKELKK